MSQRVELLIIDPQVDFCDPQRGALYVPGAEHDMRRLAEMIRRLGDQIEAIHVTLDSHHPVHIAHPIFWRDQDGQPPEVFIKITRADVERGVWRAAQTNWQSRALDYVRQLERNGRYELTVWPPHCLIGSPGHAVVPELFSALRDWEERRFRPVDYIAKGSNLFTEHFSAVQADVHDPDDPATHVNKKLIRTLERADVIVVAGEARTHCVAHTVRDVADHFSEPSSVSKLVLLTDATGDIPGFETHADLFLRDLTARGMRLTTTAEFSAPM